MRRKYRVTIIWDTWLSPDAEQDGLRLTRQIWSDMRAFDGYVSHQLFIDQNDPRHIIALGNWRRVVDADAALAEYKDSETVRQLVPLLARAREHWVTFEDQQ